MDLASECKKGWLLLLFAAATVLYTGCENVVEIDLPEAGGQIVVHGYAVTDSSRLGVQLTESVSVLAGLNEFPVIDNATVTVYENGRMLGTMEPRGFGRYTLEHRVTPGNTYRISAEKEEFPVAEAEVTVPPESISATGYSVRNTIRDGQEVKLLRFNFPDPPGDNYYEVGVVRYIRESIFDEDTGEFIQTGDSIPSFFFLRTDGAELTEDPERFGQTVIFDDALFDGQEHTVSLLLSFFDIGQSEGQEDRVYLVIRSLPRDYYRFVRTSRIQAWNSDNIFAEPVEVFSNVTGGLGAFAAYNSSLLLLDLEE